MKPLTMPMIEDIPQLECGGRTVYIVLSRSKSILSNIISTLTSDKYTHSALSLDKDLKYMFTFGRKKHTNPFIGCFKQEKFTDAFYKNYSNLPGVVLEVTLSEEQYYNIIADISCFVTGASSYRYNVSGLMRAAFRLKNPYHPNQPKNKYFCSEFVYYILHKNDLFTLENNKKNTIRPQHFLQVSSNKVFEGNLLHYTRVSKTH
ncbi:MAG: hypothetical protein FWC69_00165 [Defluviitaleaceae bacterium]|nr:hypothetical protein [Defluviitaleaceae bacterium]